MTARKVRVDEDLKEKPHYTQVGNKDTKVKGSNGCNEEDHIIE